MVLTVITLLLIFDFTLRRVKLSYIPTIGTQELSSAHRQCLETLQETQEGS
jgi:hypothetical protein